MESMLWKQIVIYVKKDFIWKYKISTMQYNTRYEKCLVHIEAIDSRLAQLQFGLGEERHSGAVNANWICNPETTWEGIVVFIDVVKFSLSIVESMKMMKFIETYF